MALFKKLEKILGIVTLTGLLTLGAGALVKNKYVEYVGAGEAAAGAYGYAIDLLLRKEDRRKLEKALGIVTMTGFLTLGTGAIAKDKNTEYIGLGETVGGVFGYVLDGIIKKEDEQ